MKHLFLLMMVGVLVGCEKKESTQPSSSNTNAAKSKTTAGDKLWEFETEGYVTSSPAIGSDGTVYVGAGDNKLYAINGKTGAKLWEFETGHWVHSSPAIGSDGIVYIASRDKNSMQSMARLALKYGSLRQALVFLGCAPRLLLDRMARFTLVRKIKSFMQ